ncbi:MAG: hypothetical protein J7K04_03200 [Spirochaetales bacterium]|nr:hypothetical protein [Spirochaetales bacterium]
MEFVRKLRELEAKGTPISVGIIGCGQMGSGLAHTLKHVVGMRASAIADIDTQRGIKVFSEMGFERDSIVVTNKKSEAEDAIKRGKPFVTENALLLTELDGINANVEATGVPDIGAQVAYDSIEHKKPIIMLNAETDVTVGYILDDIARKSGSIYTVASGDEPGVCKTIFEQASLMGFEVVTLGKGKNNPVNFEAVPEMLEEEARSKGMNPKMLTAFVDGTKTMVEMAAVSNATGLIPDVPGMHGSKVEIADLAKVFIPSKDGGIFKDKGRVDYSTGKVAPGIFAIVYADDKRIVKEMKFLTKWDGPYYLQLRPYHLCDLETPQSIAEAVLFNEVTITAEDMYSDVVCVSKRNIKAGEILEGIGGHDWHGFIMTYKESRSRKALPMGLGKGAKVVRDIKKGEVITEQDVIIDDASFVSRLRKLQEVLIEKRAKKG